jgi:uncharacterized membrane protein YfcA
MSIIHQNYKKGKYFVRNFVQNNFMKDKKDNNHQSTAYKSTANGGEQPNAKRKILPVFGGIAGVLNGLFGSGGGVAAVPLLEAGGLPAKKAHATSVAAILIISVASVAAYGARGVLDVSATLPLIPWGILGAAVGAFLLNGINNDLLRRIFGIIIAVSALRILLF